MLYLFGSMATDTFNKNSDVDIAFLSGHKISNVDRWHLQQQLSVILNVQLDLVDLSFCSDIMSMQIVSKGTLLYLDPSFNIDDFENRVYYKYIDLRELNKGIYQDIKSRGAIYE